VRCLGSKEAGWRRASAARRFRVDQARRSMGNRGQSVSPGFPFLFFPLCVTAPRREESPSQGSDSGPK
jgi:hypothetical protein